MNKRIIGSVGISGVIEFLLRAMFFIGIVIDLSLPFTLRRALRYFYWGPMSNAFYWRAFAFILTFGVLMVLFVFFAARVFRTINQGNPFIDENLRSLRVMSILSLLLSAASGTYSALGNSILAVVLSMFFLFFAGFLLVLRELFRSAIVYKQENEFTI